MAKVAGRPGNKSKRKPTPWIPQCCVTVGEIAMVDQRTQHRCQNPDSEGCGGFDGDITNTLVTPHTFGRPATVNFASSETSPLFLSDPDGESYPEEYSTSLRGYRKSYVSSRILAAAVVAAGLAALFAWYTANDAQAIIVSAKAYAAAATAYIAAAKPDRARLTARDVQFEDPGRTRANQTVGIASPTGSADPRPVLANAMPTGEEIATAYQSAPQGGTPAASPEAAAPPVATPPTKRIDPKEFATMMKRAKDLLAIGDIPPARLLLERAAEAPEPTAALMLAQTYDPEVLGTSDVRNIVPDPAKARRWYERAAQLGSTDAQRRLAQMPN